MSQVTTKDLQAAWGGISRKEAIRRAREAGAVWQDEGKSFVWELDSLPGDLQLALAGKLPTRQKPVEMGIPQAFVGSPDKYKHMGLLRAALIQRFLDMESQGTKLEEFLALYNGGVLCCAIHNELGEVASKTFYRLVADWKKDGLDGVTPKYGRNRSGAGSLALTEFEQSIAKGMWLTQNKVAAAKVARDLQEIYHSKASEATVTRFLNSIPKDIASYYRDGKSKFEARFHQHIQTDPTRYDSMGMVISDHHTLDFVVELDGRLVRPTVTVFTDYRSRKVLAWAHSVNPSTISIVQALVDMVVRYGAPQILHIDNGKDFRSNLLNGQTVTLKGQYLDEVEEHRIEGVFAHLGIKVIFALPYHGQSKPIERWFGTIAGDFSKEMPTYIGSNSITKPEDAALLWRNVQKSMKKQCPLGWEEYTAAWQAYVEHWNATWCHGGMGMDGKTPGDVFAKNWKVRRHVSPEFLELALAKTEVRTVARDGVTFGRIRYWGEALGGLVKEKVMVKQSFIDPTKATVFDIEGRFLCYAQADYFVESDDLAETYARVGNARKAMRERIETFSKSVATLEVGKRGVVDFALANQGQWKEPEAPEDLQIVQVAGGGFELPPSPQNLRLSEETKKPTGRKYKSGLDNE